MNKEYILCNDPVCEGDDAVDDLLIARAYRDQWKDRYFAKCRELANVNETLEDIKAIIEHFKKEFGIK